MQLGWRWGWEVLFVFNFFGGIILDLQGSYKDGRDSYPIPFTQLPLVITRYMIIVHLSKPRY